jgi:hypothetical protein
VSSIAAPAPSISRTQQQAPGLIWAILVEAEPRLAELERDIRAVTAAQRRQRDRRVCANAVWYGYRTRGDEGFKRRFLALVGWGRKHGPAWLQSCAAYNLGYRYLYDLLPHCRECACIRPGVW